jgi:hypothetical protein
MVSRNGGEWRVTPYAAGKFPRRNRKDWTPAKGKPDLFDVLKSMGDLGLQLERSENAKAPVPPCRF